MWKVELVRRASCGDIETRADAQKIWEDEGRTIYLSKDEAATHSAVNDLLGELLGGLDRDWLVVGIKEQKPEGVFDRLDEIAHELANDNRVELCWFLRGVFDGVQQAGAGQVPGDAYHTEYKLGRSAGRRFDAL